MVDAMGGEDQGVATFGGIPLNDFSPEDKGKIIDAIAKQDHAALRVLIGKADEIRLRSMMATGPSEVL